MQPPKMGIEDARRLYFRILHRSSVMHSRVVYKMQMFIKADIICEALEHVVLQQKEKEKKDIILQKLQLKYLDLNFRYSCLNYCVEILF